MLRVFLGKVWRAASAVCDWRTILRWIVGQPRIDVAFVTNIRDKIDVRRFLGAWIPPLGHFDGPRYWVKGVAGRTRAIYSLTSDLLTPEGRCDAKEKFIAATQWAVSRGARVNLLAASTKRLFGKNGAELKAKFPGVIFTIGDNGTMFTLRAEVLGALQKAGLRPGFARIGILGAYGFLGELMTRTLKGLGYELIGAGPNVVALQEIERRYQIPICRTFEEMGQVDAVVACTHSEKIKLTVEAVGLIRRDGRKLLVLDVAEPSNLTKKEYLKCCEFVIRQDAGNAYSPHLKNVLGAITYKMFRLSRGTVFGCFAEALAIAAALKRNEESVADVDWFTVSEGNMEIAAKLFKPLGFTVPVPRCFGQPVKLFDLTLGKARGQAIQPSAWKLVMQRLHIL